MSQHFHSPRWMALPASCAACLVTALLAAQQPVQIGPPQTTFRSAIQLVHVDVVVVDERGEHVRGLTASDFQIFDRGKTQVVAAFEEVSHDRGEGVARGSSLPLTAGTGVSSNQTTQSERLVVLVVDDLHIWRGRTETTRTIARGILSKLGRDASMAVLFTSGDRSTQVTDDPSRLLSAIDSLQGRQSVRRPNQAVDAQSPGGIDPEIGMAQQLAIVQQTQSISVQQFADNMSMIKTLEDAARLLSTGGEGRKAFVLLSEGIARNPTGLFDSMSASPQAPAGGADYASTRDAAATIVGPPPQYHDNALIDMMRAMHQSNIATYAIDPRGEVTAQELGLELHPEPVNGDSRFRWDNPVRQAQDGLSTITEASGGFAVVNTDDFTAGVDDIVEDLDHYYLLGFYPSDPDGDDFRLLRVAVPGHREWTLRFRKGYRPVAEPARTRDGSNESPLVALSAGVLPARGLPLRLGAVPLPGSGELADVALALEVSAPRSALEEADGRLRDEVRYEVIVVDEKKKKVTSAGGLAGRITLSPAGTDGPLPALVAYQVTHTIQVRPGRYQLRVSAMSTKLAKGGSVYLDLDVPDFRKERLAISGLAVGFAAGPRVPSAPGSTPGALPGAPPRAVAGAPARASSPPVLPFAPTLDRTFAATDTLRVYFEIASREGITGTAGTIALLDADGVIVHASMAFVPDKDGRVDLLVPLTAMTSGAHILRVAATHGVHSATREIAFVVQ